MAPAPRSPDLIAASPPTRPRPSRSPGWPPRRPPPPSWPRRATPWSATSSTVPGRRATRGRRSARRWASRGRRPTSATRPTPRELQRWTERAKQVLAVSGDTAALAWATPSSAPSTSCSGSSRRQASAPRCWRSRGHGGVRRRRGCWPPAPARVTGPAEPAFTPLAAQVFGRRADRSARAWATTTSAPSTCCWASIGQPDGLAAQILADAGPPTRRCKVVAELLGGPHAGTLRRPAPGAGGGRRRSRGTAGGCCTRAAPGAAGSSVRTTSTGTAVTWFSWARNHDARVLEDHPQPALVGAVGAAAVPHRAHVEHHRPGRHRGDDGIGRRAASSAGSSRWLPGTISVAPLSAVKSSSAHIVLSTTCWCGQGIG